MAVQIQTDHLGPVEKAVLIASFIIPVGILVVEAVAFLTGKGSFIESSTWVRDFLIGAGGVFLGKAGRLFKGGK